MGELESSLPPVFDRGTKLLEAWLVELELVPAKSIEPAEHLGEDGWREASVLLGGELEEAVEPIPRLEGHEVDEVARLGASEQRQELVDRELFAAERRSGRSRLGGEETCVRCVSATACTGPTATA